MLRGWLLTVQLLRLSAAWLTGDSPSYNFNLPLKKPKNKRIFKLYAMKCGVWLRGAAHWCSDHTQYSVTNTTVAKCKGSTLLISDSAITLENLFHPAPFFKNINLQTRFNLILQYDPQFSKRKLSMRLFEWNMAFCPLCSIFRALIRYIKYINRPTNALWFYGCNFIALRHKHVSATYVSIFRVVKTRIQILLGSV